MTTSSAAGDSQLRQRDLTRLRMTLGRLGRMLRQQTSESIPYPLISLIFSIHRNQPVTAGTLAKVEGLTPPSISRTLNRLLDLGMISREPLPFDRRATAIRLTDVGLSTLNELLECRELWLTGHITQLGPDELAAIIDVLPVLDKLSYLLPHGSKRDQVGHLVSANG